MEWVGRVQQELRQLLQEGLKDLSLLLQLQAQQLLVLLLVLLEEL